MPWTKPVACDTTTFPSLLVERRSSATAASSRLNSAPSSIAARSSKDRSSACTTEATTLGDWIVVATRWM